MPAPAAPSAAGVPCGPLCITATSNCTVGGVNSPAAASPSTRENANTPGPRAGAGAGTASPPPTPPPDIVATCATLRAPPAPPHTNDFSASALGPSGGANRITCCASDSLVSATVKLSSPPSPSPSWTLPERLRGITLAALACAIARHTGGTVRLSDRRNHAGPTLVAPKPQQLTLPPTLSDTKENASASTATTADSSPADAATLVPPVLNSHRSGGLFTTLMLPAVQEGVVLTSNT
mmetsp:Transcript_36442/g.89873  ORF Transcript_36442/g.89873 Transcript_36442/m.89873 type:complete len:237 (+) Transcript_36442:2-712(+)